MRKEGRVGGSDERMDGGREAQERRVKRRKKGEREGIKGGWMTLREEETGVGKTGGEE